MRTFASGFQCIPQVYAVILLSLLFFSGSANELAAQSHFVEVELPLGISIELPRHWLLIEGELVREIETSLEAALDLSDTPLPSDSPMTPLIIVIPNPETGYASVNVNSHRPPIFTFEEASSLTMDEVRSWHDVYRRNSQSFTELQGNRLLDFYEVYLDYISDYPTIVAEYRRTGIEGPVMVQMNQIFTPTQTVHVTLAWRESEKAIWRPILGKVRKSVYISQ